MKNQKIENIIFITLFSIIIMGGFIKPLLLPQDINYNENRTAQKIPELSLKSFNDKSYQNLYEEALADQIPLANRMKTAVKEINANLKLKMYNSLSKNNYYKLEDPVYLYNENLVYMYYDLDKIKEILDYRVENINEVSKNINNVDFYLYYIEKDTDINFNNNSKLNAYEYMKNKLSNNIISNKFEINNFEEYKNYFFKTDHHWSYKGFFKAYQEIIKMITDDEPISYEEEKCLNTKLRGSKASLIGATNIFKEQFCTYTFDLKDHKSYVNRIEQKYGEYDEILKTEPEIVTYGTYYGWDRGLLEFDYNNPEKENLLILGDSYDNPINEIIASHFNKTFNIDLRHYENEIDKFDIYKFIKENNINKVLLLGNAGFFIEDYFILKGGN